MSDFDDFLKRAEAEMFPKMQDSAMSVVIFRAKPDPKLAIEVGAAILMDKPLILVVQPGEVVPPVLARISSAIVEGKLDDPDTQRRFHEAINHVIDNDPRAREQ